MRRESKAAIRANDNADLCEPGSPERLMFREAADLYLMNTIITGDPHSRERMRTASKARRLVKKAMKTWLEPKLLP